MKVPIILNIYQKPESGYTKNIKRRTAAKINMEGEFMKRRFMKTVLPVCLATSMCMTGAITSSAEEGEDIVLKFTYHLRFCSQPCPRSLARCVRPFAASISPGLCR